MTAAGWASVLMKESWSSMIVLRWKVGMIGSRLGRGFDDLLLRGFHEVLQVGETFAELVAAHLFAIHEEADHLAGEGLLALHGPVHLRARAFRHEGELHITRARHGPHHVDPHGHLIR